MLARDQLDYFTNTNPQLLLRCLVLNVVLCAPFELGPPASEGLCAALAQRTASIFKPSCASGNPVKGLLRPVCRKCLLPAAFKMFAFDFSFFHFNHVSPDWSQSNKI